MLEGGRSKSRNRKTRSRSRSYSRKRRSRKLRKVIRSLVRKYSRSPRRTPYFLRTRALLTRSPQTKYVFVPQYSQPLVRAWPTVATGTGSGPIYRPPTEAQLRAERSAKRIKEQRKQIAQAAAAAAVAKGTSI